MTSTKDLRPGMTVRVQETRPVAEGIIRYIEDDDVVAVASADGIEVLFNQGDMPPIGHYLVQVLAQPGPVPEEPPLNTHWLGSDNVVYTHYHGDWNARPWMGNSMWNLTWSDVYWRARPLVQVVVANETERID
jgi:hypothetical protein